MNIGVRCPTKFGEAGALHEYLQVLNLGKGQSQWKIQKLWKRPLSKLWWLDALMAFNLNSTEINELMNKEILLIYIYLTISCNYIINFSYCNRKYSNRLFDFINRTLYQRIEEYQKDYQLLYNVFWPNIRLNVRCLVILTGNSPTWGPEWPHVGSFLLQHRFFDNAHVCYCMYSSS